MRYTSAQIVYKHPQSSALPMVWLFWPGSVSLLWTASGCWAGHLRLEHVDPAVWQHGHHDIPHHPPRGRARVVLAAAANGQTIPARNLRQSPNGHTDVTMLFFGP